MDERVIQARSAAVPNDYLHVEENHISHGLPDGMGITGASVTYSFDKDGATTALAQVFYGDDDDENITISVTKFPDGSVGLTDVFGDVHFIAGPAAFEEEAIPQ